MTPDQLRELADALEPMAQAPRFDGIDIPALCDYLRAQADAQPVAWQFKIRVWIGGDLFEERDHVSREWREGAAPLYLHPAPAAPQAEPCIGNDPICPCQDGDACHYKDSADGTKAWPVPQSEPKRKPACLWSRADDDTDVWETRCGHAFMIIDGTPGDNHMEFCCYCGRPLEQEIGDSDAE